jgi:hypothetical protein
MKPKLFLLVLSCASIVFGQESEEEKRFYDDYAKSEQRTVALYPDAAKADSPLTKRMLEIEETMKTEASPLYHSAEKPMILAVQAAKELGIKAADVKAANPEIPTPEPQTPVELDGKVIPELNGFKSVTIRRVEPDGLRIIHESGTAKIPFENLTEDQRAKYRIYPERAAQYRQQVAENNAASHARGREAAREQAVNPRPPAEAPAPKFVTADQVKVMWVRNLPKPRSLDPNYSKILGAYRDFMDEIRAGKRDLDAQETAATYNKAKAIDIGNFELANTYEIELGRISQAKSEAAELAQRVQQARRESADRARLEAALMNIDSNLRNIRSTITGW